MDSTSSTAFLRQRAWSELPCMRAAVSARTSARAIPPSANTNLPLEHQAKPVSTQSSSSLQSSGSSDLRWGNTATHRRVENQWCITLARRLLASADSTGEDNPAVHASRRRDRRTRAALGRGTDLANEATVRLGAATGNGSGPDRNQHRRGHDRVRLHRQRTGEEAVL